ncbi:MAG: sigma-70 family RNA polymerase sigma factor [candidate division Zixibacteria bacterium]|nr:sigma-70 family RNA polymerase sigma factor [candidate division Zixibacteria bacterium]
MDLNSLCEKAKKGDKNAETILFENLSNKFNVITQYRIKNKQDVEEVCQQALQVIWEKFKGTEFNVSFTSWAYRILNLKILNYIEKKMTESKRQIEDFDKLRHVTKPQTEPDYMLKRLLIECLKRISVNNKTLARVIVLQFQGYQTSEICEKLKTNRNNLYVALSRARSLMKDCLELGGVV